MEPKRLEAKPFLTKLSAAKTMPQPPPMPKKQPFASELAANRIRN